MKYRKKPIVVEAEQWFPDRPIQAVFDNNGDGTGVFFIYTLEGLLEVSPGDWIITGIAGKKYPCKPDIFAQTYEVVDE